MRGGVHAAIHDVVKKLSVLSVLHDHEDDIWGLYDLVELRDGGVSDEFEDVEFPGNSFDIGDIFYFTFL